MFPSLTLHSAMNVAAMATSAAMMEFSRDSDACSTASLMVSAISDMTWIVALAWNASRQDLAHQLRRAPHNGASAADDDRPLDQDRMLRHRTQHLVIRRSLTEPERRVLRLAAPHDLDRTNAKHRHDRAQLVDRQRLAQILAHRHLDSRLAHDLQRRPTLAA